MHGVPGNLVTYLYMLEIIKTKILLSTMTNQCSRIMKYSNHTKGANSNAI